MVGDECLKWMWYDEVDFEYDIVYEVVIDEKVIMILNLDDKLEF